MQVHSYLLPLGRKKLIAREDKILSLPEVKSLLRNVLSCLLVKWQAGFELEFCLGIFCLTKNKEEQEILKGNLRM